MRIYLFLSRFSALLVYTSYRPNPPFFWSSLPSSFLRFKLQSRSKLKDALRSLCSLSLAVSIGKLGSDTLLWNCSTVLFTLLRRGSKVVAFGYDLDCFWFTSFSILGSHLLGWAGFLDTSKVDFIPPWRIFCNLSCLRLWTSSFPLWSEFRLTF